MVRFLVLTFLLLPTACSSTDSSDKKDIQVVAEFDLGKQLTETSGLYCDGKFRYTINDSGNSPTLFAIDSTGKIEESDKVAKKNTDWESVTADNEYFYIGDFGNNAGKRSDLTILKVSRDNPQDATRLAFTYATNDISKNEYYAHDYDAEAMVARSEHLVLFSKSWLTRQLKIYYVDKSDNNQVLTPVAEVSGIPGVVTGADFDSYFNRYIIVGYTSNALGVFNPFIATLSEDFKLIDSYQLDGYGQVEGLCVVGKNDILLTQESSPFSTAKLIKLKLPE